jgi:hypothetical protein
MKSCRYYLLREKGTKTFQWMKICSFMEMDLGRRINCCSYSSNGKQPGLHALHGVYEPNVNTHLPHTSHQMDKYL